MTIRKGRLWGEPGALAPSGVVVATDAEATRVVTAARTRREPPPMLGLIGGDLAATLGATGSQHRLTTSDARQYPVDLGVALVDGVERVFVAHVLVRRPLWRGRIVAVMNAQWLGEWDLGPKSHPNDGLVDITDASLPLTDKLRARKRARTGTHIPHPKISTRRVKAISFDFDPPGTCFIDGIKLGRVRHLEVTVEPDAFTVVV